MVADVEELAADAVAVVATHLKRLAEGVATRAVDALAEHLYGVVRDRLTDDDFGQAALTRVAEQPDDERRAVALQTALIEVLGEDSAFASQIEDAVGEARRAGLVNQQVLGSTSVTVGQMRRSQISLGPMTITNTRNLRIGIGVAALATLVILIAALRGRDGGTPDEAQTESREASTTQPPQQGDRPANGSSARPSVNTFRFTYGPRDLTGPIGDCGVETSSDGLQIAFVEAFAEAGLGHFDVEVYYNLDDEQLYTSRSGGFTIYDYETGDDWDIEVLESVEVTGDLMTVRAQWDDGTSGEFVARCANRFQWPIPDAGA